MHHCVIHTSCTKGQAKLTVSCTSHITARVRPGPDKIVSWQTLDSIFGLSWGLRNEVWPSLRCHISHEKSLSSIPIPIRRPSMHGCRQTFRQCVKMTRKFSNMPHVLSRKYRKRLQIRLHFSKFTGSRKVVRRLWHLNHLRFAGEPRWLARCAWSYIYASKQNV